MNNGDPSQRTTSCVLKAFRATQPSSSTTGHAVAHLIGDVLGVRLALRSSAGQCACSDVAQVDLALRRGSAPRLASNDDGAARQHLEK